MGALADGNAVRFCVMKFIRICVQISTGDDAGQKGVAPEVRVSLP